MSYGKKTNSVILVSQYLIYNKKSYIHNMKRVCKANNVMQRIKTLRERYNWQIATIKEGVIDGKQIFYYTLIKKGASPWTE